VKIAVSIPDPLFEAAEALARRERISRSQLYARALERLLAAQDEASITAQLDSVYREHDSGLDPELAAAQAEAVREAW
jgi:metal-responsive CopG/Arc/MetJ family transcriptional regulator